MALVLDAGALIAYDRGDLQVGRRVEFAQVKGEAVLVSSGCIAQAWRSGGPKQALLARLLNGVTEYELGPGVSRSIGELCASSRTADIVDAHVALLAQDGDIVMTSDPDDIEKLLKAAKVAAVIRRC